ncbi:MAG: CPBP family glutamic-type intramembrane protease [Hydrogenothermaceae bacterium]|nr:CPBP family glutamic-type intramembrane protease [Hydrogenothermaceae bacterium]
MKLYLLLILSVFTAKFFNLYLLPFFILLIPLTFLEKDRLGLNSIWNLSAVSVLILIPFFDINYISSIFLTAFAEELFFRGYLMKFYSNLVVSILFVIPHLILYTDLHSFLTFFPSLLFGHLYLKTGSLVFSSVIHGFSNIIYDKLLPVLIPEEIIYLLNFPVG